MLKQDRCSFQAAEPVVTRVLMLCTAGMGDKSPVRCNECDEIEYANKEAMSQKGSRDEFLTGYGGGGWERMNWDRPGRERVGMRRGKNQNSIGHWTLDIGSSGYH